VYARAGLWAWLGLGVGELLLTGGLEPGRGALLLGAWALIGWVFRHFSPWLAVLATLIEAALLSLEARGVGIITFVVY